MRHVRSLGFDHLEARKLLTTSAHHALALSPPKIVTVPVVLDGTLAVDNNAASMSTDDYGDTTTSTPVAGVINGLGKVRGVWNESADSFGDYLGPDTLRLRDPQGVFVLTFNTAKLGKAQKTPQKTYYYQFPQQLAAGTGAYVKATESGTIDLNTNAARNTVESLTLATGTS